MTYVLKETQPMLRNVNDLRGYANRASDGVIGTVDDFYFDDEDWGIRYLVVGTGAAQASGVWGRIQAASRPRIDGEARQID